LQPFLFSVFVKLAGERGYRNGNAGFAVPVSAIGKQL
jgi:hypothetical protein